MNLKSPSLVLALAGGCLIFSATAHAQNLQDRINQVMQKRSSAEAHNNSKAQMLGALLFTDITVQFQDTHARDAINYLQTSLGINLVGRYNDDRAGTGIDPEAPITLNVVNKPALSVLEMILDQAGGDEETTWQLRDGFVEVGTKERLSAPKAREIRYYPIKDLMFQPGVFEAAPALDLNSALNQGQQQGGGGGGQGGGGGGGGFGGGGGGQGGGSGGQSGGSIFGGSSGQPAAQPTEQELADKIIELITETVEPDAWDLKGGEWATIRYYQGTLIIRAPDYIQRQIGGYPFAVRPVNTAQAPTARRYVTFTGGISDVSLTGLRTATTTGAVGGTNSTGSGNQSAPPQPAAPAKPAKSAKP